MGRKPQKSDRPKVYTLTQEGIDKMVENRVNERKKQYEEAVKNSLMEIIDEQIRLSSNTAIKIFMLALMESRIIGWRRIERALAKWHEINNEFSAAYDAENGDYQVAIDKLDMRFDMAVRNSTANRKGGPVDIREVFDK